MTQLADIAKIRELLLGRYDTLETKSEILKAPELKELYGAIRQVDPEDRAAFGQAVNALAQELKARVEAEADDSAELPPIDVTAPFDTNAALLGLLPGEQGTIHPLTQEIKSLSDIFERMGFAIEDSREIDDQYHMFETLNFPKGHPARDDYDTF